MSTIPMPPGVRVGIQQGRARRFAAPDPSNGFVVGFFDRGSFGQAASADDLTELFGPPPAYSPAWHAAAGMLREGTRVLTIARITGPGAANASITLDDAAMEPDPSIKVSAASPGEWGNQLKVEVTAVSSARRLIVTEDDVVVATSPAAATVAELEAWDGEGIVTVEAVGDALPAVAAAASMTGGDSDLDNVTADDVAAAAALLEAKYGPGLLVAPGITDDAAQLKLLEHAHETNRVALLDLPADMTIGDAAEHALGLAADAGDLAWRGAPMISWARQQLPDGARLVPWSGVQAAIAGRVLREEGPGKPAFGITRGGARTAARLERAFTDADRASLYQAGVNAAVDDGATIALWGYKTVHQDDLHSDLHHAIVRMVLRWQAENILRTFLAEPLDQGTLASAAGKLGGLCAELERQRAFAAWEVDVDTVNTPETMAARQLHALMRVQQTPTSDWAELLVEVFPTTTTL